MRSFDKFSLELFSRNCTLLIRTSIDSFEFMMTFSWLAQTESLEGHSDELGHFWNFSFTASSGYIRVGSLCVCD